MRVEVLGESYPNLVDLITPRLRLVAWEITRSCNLFCAHCRASAAYGPYRGELSTREALRLIDQIVRVGKPVLILSGGEPLLRRDFFQIAEYAVSKGLQVVIGTNGTLITENIAARLKEIAISRIGVSLDFPVPELQDEFRGKAGAFEAAIAGIAKARQANIEVQINSTITRLNAPYLNDLVNLALRVGAIAFHPFLLVPTGRGKGLQSAQLLPEEYERILNWFYDKQIELADKMFIKPTDAPQYLRIVRQRSRKGEPQEAAPTEKPEPTGIHNRMNSLSRGCLAGIGFCFISHRGKVQGCGYLDVEAGNIKKESFDKIWSDSPLFLELRDLSNIKGKCGVCQYKKICGGCRARAYGVSGDYLESEPYCFYEPGTQPRDKTRTKAKNAS
ncbi:MAG: radical SAM protein [Dehalococcoidales bacterium]|nr:radical SAM protein [Dehalococcoidales bacterium]